MHCVLLELEDYHGTASIEVTMDTNALVLAATLLSSCCPASTLPLTSLLPFQLLVLDFFFSVARAHHQSSRTRLLREHGAESSSPLNVPVFLLLPRR